MLFKVTKHTVWRLQTGPVKAANSPCFMTKQPLFDLQTGAVCYPISPISKYD